MKAFLAILVIVAFTQAEDTVDWSKVKPAWFRLPALPANLRSPRNWMVYWKEHFGKGNRIVVGSEATPHSIPYQAGLLITTPSGMYFCGGSLISPGFVLTVAHCLENATRIEVRLGAHRVMEWEATQVRLITTKFTLHQAWDRERLLNDIAVIELPMRIQSNEYIQFVKLPRYSDRNNTFGGITARMSGWGRESDNSSTMSPVLREVSGNVLNHLNCNMFYLGAIDQNSHICTQGTGGRGACHGDSGGPLVIDDIQIGAVAFSLSLGCQMGWPTGFTRLTSFLEWITANSDITIVP